jgi:hypothetical protein
MHARGSGSVQCDLLRNVGVGLAMRHSVYDQHKRLLVQLWHPRAPEVVCGPIVLARRVKTMSGCVSRNVQRELPLFEEG